MRVRITSGLLVAALISVGTSGIVVDASASDVDDARERAEDAIRELDQAQEDLGRLEQRVSEVEHRLEVASDGIDVLAAEVQAVVVHQYMHSGEPPELVPSDADVGDQLLGNELARFVAEGDTDAIDAYTAQRAELEDAAAELDALQAEQAAAVEALNGRNQRLQEEVARLEELERERIKAERRRIEEERQRREEAERAAREAAEAEDPPADTPNDPSGPAGPTGPPSGGGDFLCPVPGSTFIDSWGYPRSGGRRHQGVDMMASAGTPVYASVSGTVEHRGTSLGGMSYFLTGDNGNTYYGTHLSAYGTSGRVVAGTVVGYVGATGNANGINHLHFEIWPGGGPAVNPYPTVAAAC